MIDNMFEARMVQDLKEYSGIADIETKLEKIRKDETKDVFIVPVLGVQGAGKSSFINALLFDNIVLLIGIVFGLVLVADGLITMVNTWMYARRAKLKNWWLLVLLSLLLIAGGVIILVNPWWNEAVKLFDAIGVMLLFSSLVGIVRLIIIWPIKDEEED